MENQCPESCGFAAKSTQGVNTQALRPPGQYDCEFATSAVCVRESILKMVAVSLREQAFRSPVRAIIFFKFIGDSDLKYVGRRKFARRIENDRAEFPI